MSVEVKSEIQDYCTVCFRIVSDLDTKILDEEVLRLLQSLSSTISTNALQDSIICRDCFTKIEDAYKFKTSIKNLKGSCEIKVKEETVCDERYVTCYICKNNILQTSCVHLSELSIIQDIVFDLFSKEVILNTQICEACKISVMNFQSITDSLFNNCDNKINIDLLGSDIKYTPFLRDVNLENHIINVIKEEIKVEMETTATEQVRQIEEGDCIQDFQVINEELNLKMDQEEEEEPNSNEGIIKLNNQKVYTWDNPKVFHCKVCDYRTKQGRTFRRHLIIHKNVSETEMFRCHLCDYKTKFKDRVKGHMLCHTDIKDTKAFQCQICQYQSKRKQGLQQHMLVHKNSESDLIKCSICDFRTKYKKNISKHMIVHKDFNETAIFKCELCEFRTKRKYSLKKHMIRHKDTSTSRTINCHICDYQTKYKANLDKHMLCHKDINEIKIFKCQLCQYQSIRKQGLNQHMISHKTINEIPVFMCYLCDYQSKRKHHLKQHMSRHKHLNK